MTNDYGGNDETSVERFNRLRKEGWTPPGEKPAQLSLEAEFLEHRQYTAKLLKDISVVLLELKHRVENLEGKHDRMLDIVEKLTSVSAVHQEVLEGYMKREGFGRPLGAAKAYSCPVCGVSDPNAYLRCSRADCTDGRDPR